MTLYRPLSYVYRYVLPPLEACPGEAGSNRCASCVLLRLLTIGNTWPTPNTSTLRPRRPSDPAQLTSERPSAQHRSCARAPLADSARQSPTGQAYNMVAELVNLIQMAPHLRLHCTTPTSTRHRGTARRRAPPHAARTRARNRQPALNPTTRPAPQSSSNGCSRLHETSPAEDLRTRTRTRPGHA